MDELKKQLVSKTNDDKVISTNGGDTNIQKADINTLNNGTINNIVINNYGHEKAMTEKEVQKLITIAMKKCNDINSNPWEALNHTLQQIHFNQKYPENQNLKLTNISSPIMDVYTNDKWRKVPFVEQIKIIIESLMDYIENNQDKVDLSSNYWEELYDKLADYFSGRGEKRHYNKVETSMKCQLYNETQDGAIPPTPVLMGIGLVKDIRKCTSSDMKKEGSIWIIGETKEEMGASLYYRHLNLESGNVPTTNFEEFMPRMEQLIQAIENEEVVACHDISTGGLAISIIEMCMSGIGANIELTSDLRADIELFSESNGRWVVQVAPGCEKKFSNRFDYVKQIGNVDEKILFTKNGEIISKLDIEKSRKNWTEPLWNRLA